MALGNESKLLKNKGLSFWGMVTYFFSDLTTVIEGCFFSWFVHAWFKISLFVL